MVKSLLKVMSPLEEVKLVVLDDESIKFRVTFGIAVELEPRLQEKIS